MFKYDKERSFLINMERELHEKMESAWKSVATLRESLEVETTELKCSFGNYVRIDGELRRQEYPVPTFQIEGIGEVGYDYEKFYLVVAVDRISVTREFIEDLLKIGYRVVIYGARNFLRELSKSGDSGEIFRNIENFDEEVIQIEIDFFEDNTQTLKEILEQLHALFERHGIRIVP